MSKPRTSWGMRERSDGARDGAQRRTAREPPRERGSEISRFDRQKHKKKKFFLRNAVVLLLVSPKAVIA